MTATITHRDNNAINATWKKTLSVEGETSNNSNKARVGGGFGAAGMEATEEEILKLKKTMITRTTRKKTIITTKTAGIKDKEAITDRK